jgi:hypothetical protein
MNTVKHQTEKTRKHTMQNMLVAKFVGQMKQTLFVLA